MPFQQRQEPKTFLIMNPENRMWEVMFELSNIISLQLSWHSLEPATFLRWTVSLVQQKN
jgi:hypothetical protein